MPTRVGQLPAIVTWVAGVVALAVTIIIPAGYFSLKYEHIAGATQTKADIKSELISQMIAAHPRTWKFQDYRLEELLLRHPAQLDEEFIVVFDRENNTVMQTGERVAPPAFTRGADLFDSGVKVGRLEIRRSMRALALETALVALLGVALGGAVFVVLRAFPLRALREVTEALFREKERAQVTLHSIGDAVITTDTEERIEYMNPVAEGLTGWKLAEVRGRALSEVFKLVNEVTNQPLESPVRKVIAERRIVPLENHTALVRRDGELVSIEDSAAPIPDAQGNIIGVVMVFHDVSKARDMAQQLSWQASHDALTGLINRREFENRLVAALASARNEHKQHAVCYIDLDQFKVVNDTCGHVAGDELLRQLANLLHSRVRESDTLARLGGDEFGLLLVNCPLNQAQRIAGNLLEAVRSYRFTWEDKTFTIGVSIGLAEITQRSAGKAQVLSAVDAACYAAKNRGRNRVQVYEPGDHEITRDRGEMAVAARITRALDEDRFVLYCQPYIALAGDGDKETGTHCEVLLRMLGEDGRLVPPGAFISAAERYNLMPEIDRWVIRKAFGAYAGLALTCGRDMLALNLSGTSVNSEKFLEFIAEQAKTHAVPPEAICFEVTETAAVNNLRKAVQFIKDLKAMGFRFALDDFGNGFSSFSYLKNLPVDYLKIDGGFVRNMLRNPVDYAMVTAINQIGHVMGLHTIAEWVDSEAILAELKRIGVDFAQGFAVARPRPLAELRKKEPAAPQEAVG